MRLKREAEHAYVERIGPVALSYDDLLWIESKLPQWQYRSLEAGPYEIDSVSELTQAPEDRLDGIYFWSRMSVIVDSRGATVRALDRDDVATAQEITHYLRQRRVRRITGFDTRPKVASYVLLLLLIGVSYVLQFNDIVPSQSFVWIVLLGLLAYFYANSRMEARRPILLRRPALSWIERYGWTISIVVALLVGAATVVTTIAVSQ